jgi:hypothetical protein
MEERIDGWMEAVAQLPHPGDKKYLNESREI